MKRKRFVTDLEDEARAKRELKLLDKKSESFQKYDPKKVDKKGKDVEMSNIPKQSADESTPLTAGDLAETNKNYMNEEKQKKKKAKKGK